MSFANIVMPYTVAIMCTKNVACCDVIVLSRKT